MRRIALWFSILMDITQEVWDIQILIEKHLWVHPIEFPDISKIPEPDKSFMDISCMFSGHARKDKGYGLWQYIQDGDSNTVIHQLCHGDFPDIKKDGQEYSVSNNPDLVDQSKSGTLGFALKEPCNIYFGSLKDHHTVSHGQAVWFNGDKSHFGKSYLLTDPVQYQPLLHIHLESKFHPHTPNELNVHTSTTTYIPFEHLELLDPKNLNRIWEDEMMDIVPGFVDGDDLINTFNNLPLDSIQEQEEGRNNHQRKRRHNKR